MAGRVAAPSRGLDSLVGDCIFAPCLTEAPIGLLIPLHNPLPKDAQGAGSTRPAADGP
jgi:hypothetical protein